MVVYDAPSTTGIPLSVRAGWVRKLYPQVRVIEGWAGTEAPGDSPQVQREITGPSATRATLRSAFSQFRAP